MIISTHKKLIIVLSFVVIAILLITTTSSPKTPPPPSPIDPNRAIPGLTTEGEIKTNAYLYHSTNENNQTSYYFGTNKYKYYTNIVTQGGVVKIVKKTIPSTFEFNTYSEYQNKYGQPTTIEKTSWSDFGFSAYNYSQVGKIILANPTTDEIMEEWIIPKTMDLTEIKALFNSPTTQVGN